MDTTLPTVAIATRSSRSANFLERVLDGLQKQTGAKLIWSIVTQKSLTEAHETCFERAKSMGIDVHITQANPSENLGKLANIAINAVESTHVLLHDDDDELNQDFIGPALNILGRQHYVAVACHAAFIRESPNTHALDFILSPGTDNVCLESLLTNNLMVVHGLIYPRTAFENVGGYNEEVTVAEDWLLNIELRKSGEIAVLNRVCANVYLRNSTAAHTSHQEHLHMKTVIRSNEGAQNNVTLEKRINTFDQKIRRQVDRVIFRLSGKFLPR